MEGLQSFVFVGFRFDSNGNLHDFALKFDLVAERVARLGRSMEEEASRRRAKWTEVFVSCNYDLSSQ